MGVNAFPHTRRLPHGCPHNFGHQYACTTLSRSGGWPYICNSGSFRRSAPGGERWTWEDWVNKRLPELLPGEAGKVDWADDRRVLWEVRTLLSLPGVPTPGALPTATQAHAKPLKSLIPRKVSGANANWQPAILDDPDAAEGLRVVWGLALQNAAKQQRKSGPTPIGAWSCTSAGAWTCA